MRAEQDFCRVVAISGIRGEVQQDTTEAPAHEGYRSGLAGPLPVPPISSRSALAGHGRRGVVPTRSDWQPQIAPIDDVMSANASGGETFWSLCDNTPMLGHREDP